ncbi:MAG: hypothetical protein Q9187_005883 [Circinaria calcarea]
MLQTLCGGVHILDFLTLEPDLYASILPQDWRNWFHVFDISDILDLLMREDVGCLLASATSTQPLAHGAIPTSLDGSWRNGPVPPLGLLKYIHAVRNHNLLREFHEDGITRIPDKSQALSRQISVGMKPKKAHEVEKFAVFIDGLATDIATEGPYDLTHVIDFGSGQNYLGRVLASQPYEKQVIAVESKQLNIEGAKSMDINARLAKKEIIRRNKKAFRMGTTSVLEPHEPTVKTSLSEETTLDLQAKNASTLAGEPQDALENGQGIVRQKNKIHYIEHTIQDGDLTSVIDQLRPSLKVRKQSVNTSESRPFSATGKERNISEAKSQDAAVEKPTSHQSLNPDISDNRFMVVSLHSCGNLVHHGLRSLILNQSVRAVAMVGCCYNLVTERLGPPTYKIPTLRAPNARVEQSSSACDPHGFPMSERMATYTHEGGEGIRLNITARMMAVQAPQNWTAVTCEAFFTRHFYRALLQRIFLDRGIVKKPTAVAEVVGGGSPRGWSVAGQPITIGSLRKACYNSFVAYVRGAVAKTGVHGKQGTLIKESMDGLTDEELMLYEKMYESKKKELSIIWSLMAFSAGVVESVIVVDRWLYLKEQKVVKDCWVQTVFDYAQSPRNLVVVGVKRSFDVQSSAKPFIAKPRPNMGSAGERDGTNRFKSRIFTVTVGANNQTFNVHESVLSKSPVLARMCSGGFQESVSCAIQLLEDQPEIFGYVLEFLYMRSDGLFTEGHDGSELAKKLADIYVMAEKYQIDSLKQTVIEMLSSIPELQQKPILFFRLARKIYQWLPDSDLNFRRFYRQHAASTLRMIDQDGLDYVRAIVNEGGTLATDTFDVQRAVFDVEKKESSATKAALESERKAIELERKTWKEEKDILAKLVDKFVRSSK